MDVANAYNTWAAQYDTNENKTRDLEAITLRQTLSSIHFDSCLEVGCGTGKNTEWLITKASQITSVDLSEQMLAIARKKIQTEKVNFVQADILKTWDFAEGKRFDLACFSLVLEHIENLEPVFEKLAAVINPGGFVYIGELHPFKQYTGSKARFETENGTQVVSCFNHHISEFIAAAKNHGFEIVALNESFDNNDTSTLPRILTLLFSNKKNNQ